MLNLFSGSDIGDLLFEKASCTSQRELAAEIGISAAELSHILSGRRPPSAKVLTYLDYEKVIYYRPLHQ